MNQTLFNFSVFLSRPIVRNKSRLNLPISLKQTDVGKSMMTHPEIRKVRRDLLRMVIKLT